MKYLPTIFIFLILNTTAISQEFLKVKEVFDFEVGDKYQSRSENYVIDLPNADRITIIDKYYSSNRRTLFYVRFHDSYYTIFHEEPPSLEYIFWTETDTVSYTYLDNYINDSPYWMTWDTTWYIYDTINTISEYYCDSLVNGYYYYDSDFEPSIYGKTFGNGIGLVSQFYHYSELMSRYSSHRWLFYYEKNGIGCGNEDITVSTPEKEMDLLINIYPNPTDGVVKIMHLFNENLKMKIFDIHGKLIDSKTITQQTNTYDCSSFTKGIYFLVFSTETHSYRKKLVVR